MTKMLNELELQSLKDRRKDKRLIQLYNVQKGLVPAIPANDYLKPIQSKRNRPYQASQFFFFVKGAGTL